MNHRERFLALFRKEPIDRLPVYFFGTWPETKQRWLKEGFQGPVDLYSDAGPQVPGMDPDWEDGLWDCHGLVYIDRRTDEAEIILDEQNDLVIRRNGFGDIYKTRKDKSSVPHFIEYGLKPDRASWEAYKQYLNPDDPARRPHDWPDRARQIQSQDRVLAFMGGSLYGWPRNWMGILNLSYLMYDDPDLLRDMVNWLTDYYITMFRPVLEAVSFDLVYIFEDCCGADGPLFSPSIYRSVFDEPYRKLISFYKDHDVKLALIDSDGRVEPFIPLWIESGFDIIFPVEVGKWKASPVRLRKQFGSDLKMMGGIDKHILTQGELAIRHHLEALRPAVMQGGYLPMPDHRIPPECSYEQFLTYLRLYKEVFRIDRSGA